MPHLQIASYILRHRLSAGWSALRCGLIQITGQKKKKRKSGQLYGRRYLGETLQLLTTGKTKYSVVSRTTFHLLTLS